MRLAAVTTSDGGTAVGQAPLTFTAAVKAASRPTYATMYTPTASVGHPPAATQTAATSTVVPDEDDNPYLDQFLRPFVTVVAIVLLPILLPMAIAVYAWNTVVYIPNRVLDALGLPGLPCAGSCDNNLFDAPDLFQPPLISLGAPVATTSGASTLAADTAGNSGSALTRGSASATPRAAHSARNLVNEVARPSRVSLPAHNSVAATAVEAENGTQNSTPAEQGRREAENSAKSAAASAKSGGTKNPSTGSSARGSGPKKSVHKAVGAKSGGSENPSTRSSARANSKKGQPN